MDNNIRVPDDFVSGLLSLAEARSDVIRLFEFVIQKEVNRTSKLLSNLRVLIQVKQRENQLYSEAIVLHPS
jgi:hypothetical protein